MSSDGRLQEPKGDALGSGFLDLRRVRRHLISSPSIVDRHFRAQAQACPGRIKRRVSAADDDDSPTDRRRDTDIDVTEKGQSGHDSRIRIDRYGDASAPMCPGSYEDGIEFLLKTFDVQVQADPAVRQELHAHPGDPFDFSL
jgi:hypothetical protein